MKLKILFFGILAEVAETDSINLEYEPDIEFLKNKIKEMYPQFENYNYRISVNRVLVDGNSSLKEGDEVAFLPPFAGG